MKDVNKSEEVWLSQILWNIGLASIENGHILFELAASFCEGERKTTCHIAQLGRIFAQEKDDYKIDQSILTDVSEALASPQNNEQIVRLLTIFRFNTLVLMKQDLSRALIDAMERGMLYI